MCINDLDMLNLTMVVWYYACQFAKKIKSKNDWAAPQKSEVEKIDTKITIMSKPLIHSVQTEKSGKKVEL